MGSPSSELFSPEAHINHLEERFDIPELPRSLGVAKELLMI